MAIVGSILLWIIAVLLIVIGLFSALANSEFSRVNGLPANNRKSYLAVAIGLALIVFLIVGV